MAVAELERENEELKSEVDQLKADAKRKRDEDHEARKESAARGCVLCGGSLLPVAVFSGRQSSPNPLSVSTLRFGRPDGGFTGSAPIKSKACSSCGFIHLFIDVGAPEAVDVTRELQIGESDDEAE